MSLVMSSMRTNGSRHNLHARQAHLATHLLDGLKLHHEALLKEGVRLAAITAAAAEANHRVLIRLVLVAATQTLVLVELEVRERHMMIRFGW